MMLNQMLAGRPALQWNEFEAYGFTDCEWSVEDMEFLGVKDRYILIRGTNSNSYVQSLRIPGGFEITTPLNRSGFVLQYHKTGDIFEFLRARSIDAESNTNINIPRNPSSSLGDSRFLVIAKTVAGRV